MKNQTGFTLVELLVSLAIVGILFGTAIPVYRTWQQRAYGQEATLMAKQILDGQILYYLDNDNFFPDGAGDFKLIPKDSPPSDQVKQDLQDIKDAINISIPVGHHLEYLLTNYGDQFQVRIDAGFPLFKGGYTRFFGTVDKTGQVILFPG